MPIYEYCCQECQHIFEEWQKDFVERDMACPICGGQAKRLISNTAFILKGSGWYVTDYARNSNITDNGNGNGKGAKEKETVETEKSEKSGTETTSSKDTESNKAKTGTDNNTSTASGTEKKSANQSESK